MGTFLAAKTDPDLPKLTVLRQRKLLSDQIHVVFKIRLEEGNEREAFSSFLLLLLQYQ